MSALAALTERSLMSAARDRGLFFEMLSPVVYLAGFTVALHGLIDTGRVSYSQYLVPAVVVQSVIFVALLTGDRAARDHLWGLGERLATLPIAAAVPVSARMVATLIRAALALSVAMVAGYAFGFRMTGGLGYPLAFVLIALLLCLAVALGADALGSGMSSFQGVSQLLMVPQLLLFMLSTGIAPRENLSRLVAPVRAQPAGVTGRRNTARPGHRARGGRQLGGQPGLVSGHGAGLWRDHATAAEADLVIPQPGIQGSLLTQSWVQAGRLLTGWRRNRGLLIGSLVFPVCLLLGYEVVLGEQVRKVTGVDSVYGLVPLCAVLSALFGALSTSVGIMMERQLGLLSRMWVLPVHRASTLTGRLTAEAARALIGTVLITALGVTMGLRFTHGWPTALVYILIPSIVVVGFTALVMALAIRTNGRRHALGGGP